MCGSARQAMHLFNINTTTRELNLAASPVEADNVESPIPDDKLSPPN
jgi:hypothetical protein